jgi:hypothetical protein
VDSATLDGGAGHRGLDGLAQPEVGVGDDQLHPGQPRAFKLRKKAVQKAPSSESPTANPSTSRRPSPHTPLATTTAWATTRRLTRALQ